MNDDVVVFFGISSFDKIAAKMIRDCGGAAISSNENSSAGDQAFSNKIFGSFYFDLFNFIQGVGNGSGVFAEVLLDAIRCGEILVA